MLYIVPTPIGNLEDITLRALRILKEVAYILAEDTRNSSKLLQHYKIDTSLRSHHAHNEHQSLSKIIAEMKAGVSVALISDAGTPSISDPGFLLVRECVREGIKIECLPGATAFVPALVVSGFPTDKFFFEGFLPHKKGRQTRWKYLSALPCTFILYESPFRILKCLEELAKYVGENRQIVVVRELTKKFEEILRGEVSELITHFKKHTPKGEFVIIVKGYEEVEAEEIENDEQD